MVLNCDFKSFYLGFYNFSLFFPLYFPITHLLTTSDACKNCLSVGPEKQTIEGKIVKNILPVSYDPTVTMARALSVTHVRPSVRLFALTYSYGACDVAV